MQTQRVSYALHDRIALITLDDGKVNALSPAMLTELDAALDRAERDGVGVVLTGRDRVFCGGFDLKVLRAGGVDTLKMLRGGFELAARMLAFPTPIVVACNGHAMAMGAFLLLSADYRIGAHGDFTFQANEVAIGLTMPRAAVAICRQRLAPSHFQRAAMLSEPYTPETAVEAGFLDRVVDAERLRDEALAHAQQLMALDMTAYLGTKLRVRAEPLRVIKRSINADTGELAMMGVRQLVKARLGR